MKADERLPRGTARKMLLLDEAVRIVAEFGANSLTHRAVAKGAQVSLASVSYHFPSGEALRSATYEYAGSQIGQELVRLVLETASNLESLPDICADFTARLVTDHRINTMTVFEMIVAAGHDPQLSPVTRLLNERLAKLLAPYLGSNAAAHTVSAALQGLVLTALAIDPPKSRKWLRSSVSDLIRRYRIVPSQRVANSSTATQIKQEKHATVAHTTQRARVDDRIRRVNPHRVPR